MNDEYMRVNAVPLDNALRMVEGAFERLAGSVSELENTQISRSPSQQQIMALRTENEKLRADVAKLTNQVREYQEQVKEFDTLASRTQGALESTMAQISTLLNEES